MTADVFTFDNISCDRYNLVIGSFNGSRTGTYDAGNVVQFTTIKAPKSNTFYKAGASYEDALQITFDIIKADCSDVNNYVLSEREQAFIMRWLCRKEYCWLHFDQDGWDNVYYHCYITAQKYEVGGECVGYTLTATCDAPFGWSGIYETQLESDGGTVDETYLIEDDEIGQLYPKIVITSNADNQTITLKNNTTGESMIIKNCMNGEIITIDNFTITSNMCTPINTDVVYRYEGNHSTLYNDFNYNWFYFVNMFTPGNVIDELTNKIQLKGAAKVKITHRYPRKAVV